MVRFRHIDIAKGIAILFVLIGHFMFLPSLHLQRLAYTFHTPLFFICAGAFYKPKSFTHSLKKDFKRLLIPLLVTFFIWEFLKFKSGQSTFLPHYYFSRLWYNYQDTTLQQGIDDTIGILWFLPTLFWCKTFFNLLYQIRFKPTLINNKSLIFSYQDLLIVAISLLAAYSSRFFWLPMEITQGLSVMIFYLGGLKLKQVIIEGVNLKFLLGLILIWIAGFLLAYDPQLGHLSWLSLISFPAAIAGSLCIIILSQYINSQAYKWGGNRMARCQLHGNLLYTRTLLRSSKVDVLQ